jgi:hypothetical protein
MGTASRRQNPVRVRVEATAPIYLLLLSRTQFWGAYRRPRKEKKVIIIFFTLSLFFFFFSLTRTPSPLFPISPFPFPVEPHPITLLVSESSRHTCHTNPSIITCPFQLIIPNRTPVHRPIITVSPRKFIIKHTRPSWRVSNNQIPNPLGGVLSVSFTTPQMVTVPNIFVVLATTRPRIISSPLLVQPTTPPIPRHSDP